MLSLFKRYTEENIGDDHCQQLCNQWLRVVGIRPNQTLTVHSAMTFFTLLFTLSMWTYTYFEANDEDSTEALHHICLTLLALGLFSVQFFRHKEIISVAKQVDECISYSNQELKYFFRQRQRKLFTSGMKLWTDIYTILVFSTWSSILINIYIQELFVSDIKPPVPMILPIDSKVLCYLMYITEGLFYRIACTADLMVAHMFMMFTLQLSANFEVLRLSLKSLSKFANDSNEMVPDSKINTTLTVSIKHHQEILKSFESIKILFDKIFYILYFSMMSAIAMSRTLLVGDIDIKQLLPLFSLELSYIYIFCHFIEIFIEESSNLCFASYSTPWYNFSSNICISLRIVMTRTLKQPKMYFFIGGSDVSCSTFTLILNASMTYFFISFMVGNQN